MKTKLQLVKRRIAGDTILVPVGSASLKLNGLISLNEVGEFIWDKLEAAADEAEMTDLVTQEYEVARETAQSDVREFMDRLRELEII